MEDDLNRRQPQWRKTSMEVDLNGRTILLCGQVTKLTKLIFVTNLGNRGELEYIWFAWFNPVSIAQIFFL